MTTYYLILVAIAAIMGGLGYDAGRKDERDALQREAHEAYLSALNAARRRHPSGRAQ